ncbi:acylphosphatase [Desulfoferrobacter suflitae]|uniref:acylphosphatase n=1 Tax=Desulfoferrobacter suflitae TaxID=2865782 RepID=UPI002164B522|nr:acylphosphatase [Desulfoferrobacter suflitae]MCK8602701.1 acylphosphatase [Desulfoferrobacter suflitae]
MSNRRVHVWVSGRVQGVFFRSYTRDAALQRGLKGWVRNLPDGRVEAVFEGDNERVEDMLSWCKSGSPLARVEYLEVHEEEFRGDLLEFEIRYPG